MGQEKKQEALGWILAQKYNPSILSIDVDMFTLEDAEHYVRQLQKKEDVGKAVIVESSDLHFHIYFFWKMLSWEKCQEIIQNCPIADNQFKQFTKYNNFIRMRISGLYKPSIKRISDRKWRLINYPCADDELGDFYFKHYLFSVGFAQETIDYCLMDCGV